MFDMCTNDDDFSVESVETGLPLHNIPFPAITICAETKSQKSIVNVTEAYHNIHHKSNETIYSDEE